MHVSADLGFSSLILVFCAAFPVVFFLLRRKWQLAVARKEEIKRLLVLASEEAARAELEATFSYTTAATTTTTTTTTTGPVSRNNYQCAVCYCPTTTRCARCKSVRYCSGKCQIIHWRQGHKEECRPPDVSFSNSDNGSNAGCNIAKQEQHVIYDDIYETANIVHLKNGDGEDHVKVDSIADTDGACSSSESSGTSFSGFSSSPPVCESSDDSSVGESISSNESEESEVHISAHIATDIQGFNLDKGDQTKPSSPKFSNLVDSLDSFGELSKLNQSKSNDKHEDNLSSTPTSTSASPCESTIPVVRSFIEPHKSSDFWGRALDSVATSSDARDDSDLSSNNGATKLSDSESPLQFKFNLSGRNDHMFTTERSVAKGVSNDSHEAADSKPIDKASSSLKIGDDEISARKSSSVSSENTNTIDNRAGRDSDSPKFSEPQSGSSYFSHLRSSSRSEGLLVTDASKVKRFSSANFDNSNLTVTDPVDTSHLSESKLSSGASQHNLIVNTSGRSVSKVCDADVCPSNVTHTASFSTSSIYGLKSSMQKVVDQFRGPKCGRYSDKGLFPYNLFVKLYTSNKVEVRPFGLINCGNSCYANAVLQCLAFTPPLTAFLVQGFHSKACAQKEWCFTCEFERLIFKAKEGKSPLSPIGILSQLPNIGSRLGNGKEEDAHEFLRYAIDAMQSVCLKEAGVNASGSSEEETTLIGLTFGGYLRSKIKCLKCHFKSERQERMMDLAVEIEGEIGKLEDALKRFTSTEILDGDNKYKCGRCKSYEKAKKKLTILEAPNILTVALKRFQSGKFGKLNKPIWFPEILDLAPYMSGTSDKTPIYRLYGVIVHLDVMNAAFSGHYVCYVKNIQNKWFKIDDSTVTPVELERVLTKGAYMLLYARCSPRAPRLIRSNMVSPDAKNKGITGKNTLNSRSTSTRSNVVQLHPDSLCPDNLANVGSSHLKFHRLQRILEQDSSDNSSFTSSNSDEGSYSTDSTRDSTSADDISDFIFGGWNSSWMNMSDSDTSSSSSSSPLYFKCIPFADAYQNSSTSQTYHADSDSVMEHGDLSGREPCESRMLMDLEGGGPGGPFLQSNTVKQCKNWLSSSSSRNRKTDTGKVGLTSPLNDVRRSTSERTY
ncbi:hypothetical protein K2173_028488 [Erythroxylum novogranatense]|uniref:ubiquitinyl hydrolase 1 n=1 Tax=Erythroxylum novogranatense TaxID=1862640 RepID=A0AAV8U3B4_9ROSI|nr:hypothetical protein K2173_028488 [Erythroxylum novogranatense]